MVSFDANMMAKLVPAEQSAPVLCAIYAAIIAGSLLLVSSFTVLGFFEEQTTPSAVAFSVGLVLSLAAATVAAERDCHTAMVIGTIPATAVFVIGGGAAFLGMIFDLVQI